MKGTLSTAINLCALTKTPKRNIEYELTEYCVSHFNNVKTDTQGFIAADDKRVYIVFKGTSNAKDWETNRNIKFTTLSHGFKAHKGFSKAYQSVSETIRIALEAHKGKDIYITGYSLGGALANVCFYDVTYNLGIQVSKLITFGSPRVFDEDSAALLNNLYPNVHHRIVNNNDIAPHVPPELLGYGHWGSLGYFTEHGEYLPDNSLTWWRAVQETIHGLIDDIGEEGLDSIKDHSLSVYKQLVEDSEVSI